MGLMLTQAAAPCAQVLGKVELFKLLLFVLVDGWQLVVGSLMKSFG